MNTPEGISHDQARELLPWLVNDSLQARERNLVREHAASCVICRRELIDLNNLRDSVSDTNTTVAIPAPDMRRINARIDAFNAKEHRGQRFLAGLRGIGDSPWRIAFATQTALLIGVVIVVSWPTVEEPEFTTLTQTESLHGGHYFRVVFEPTLAAADLSILLDNMQLTIVDGPSGKGVYTLRLGAPASAAEREALLEKLQGYAGVQFAQPVTTGVP